MNKFDLTKTLRELGVAANGHYNRKGWTCAPCPLARWTHAKGVDSHPSFYACKSDDGPSSFNCYSCGSKGTIERLALLLHGYGAVKLSKVQEITLLEIPGKFADWDVSRFIEQETRHQEPVDPKLFYRMYPEVSEASEAVAYLRKRRVSRAAAQKLGLRFDPDQKRVLFPIFNEGQILGATGRSILPKSSLKVRNYEGVEKTRYLLGENLFRPGKPFFILEGLIGVARALTVGADQFCNVAGLMGATMSEEQAAILCAYNAPVFLMLDDNEAGNAGIAEAVRLLGNALPLFVGMFPRNVTDVDDLTKKDIEMILNRDHVDAIQFIKRASGPKYKQQTTGQWAY